MKTMNIFMKICVLSFATVVNSQNHHRDDLSQSTTKYIPGSDVLAKTTHRDFSRKTDGSYSYQYETSNGISAKESGMSGKSVHGSSSYVSPEGVEISLQYTADETGYHPVGDHIPKIPDYILRSLEYIRTHPYKIADSSGNVKTVTFAPDAFHQLKNQPVAVERKQSPQYNQQTQQPQQQRRHNLENQPSKYQQQSDYRQQQSEQQQQQQLHNQQQRRQQERHRAQRNQQQQPRQNEQEIHRRQRNNQQQNQSEQQHYQRKREQEQFEKQKEYYREQQLSPLFSRDRSLNEFDRSQRRFF